MTSFREMVEGDIGRVFLNVEEFGELRTIRWDGEVYSGVPVLLEGATSKQRRQLAADHAQGLFLVTDTLSCAASVFGGGRPERGQRIEINTCEGGAFFRVYYVASCACEMGMLVIELEAIDE